ncbi:MAG: ABC transporter permease [Planctomycetes bacterium]|nr:ABC transporter permease [Planctomycetota bacterium]
MSLRSTFGPTLKKERLGRIRARGAMAWFMAYTLLLAVGCGTVYFLENPRATPVPGVGWNAGGPMFRAMAHVQLLLIVLVAPGLACSVFSQEKERGTLELLVTVPVDAGDLVMGKLLASLALLLLLVSASLPMAGICLLLGGIDPGTVLATYATMAVTVLSTGMVGTWASARFLRTGVAGIAAYGLVAGAFALGILELVFPRSSAFLLVQAVVMTIAVLWIGWAVARPVANYFHRGYSQTGCIGVVLLYLGVGGPLLLGLAGGVPLLLVALNPFLLVEALCSGAAFHSVGSGDVGLLATAGGICHAILAGLFWFWTRAELRPVLAGSPSERADRRAIEGVNV